MSADSHTETDAPASVDIASVYAEMERDQARSRSRMDKNPRRVIVADDELNQRMALAGVIRRWGYEVETASDGAEALEKYASFPADVVVTDLNMPGMDGKGLLEELQKLPTTPQSIVLTGFGNLETALETVHRLGAFWYLEKPVHPPALEMILERAIEKQRLSSHTVRLERELASRGVLGELTGDSPSMREVFYLLQQVAPTTATVLITGESGTGKELAARTLHQLSKRSAGPFFAINCAAMPESLIESELFGHEKGAFTGAVEKRAGCFELAQGGTLLLDEIGDMPLSTQATLLRVLEESKVRRLGSPREVSLDVRVLAATNRDLREAISSGTFREDLYFRLAVFEVRLPPLRDRRQDIQNLAMNMVTNFNRKHGCRVTEIAPATLSLLEKFDWPGNVRELRNVIERAVILAGEGAITPTHLPRGFAGTSVPAPVVTPSGEQLALEPGMTIAEAERALIEITLRHTGNNRTRAAQILDITPKTLFNKLRAYGAEA
ncbi:MAG: two component, sigma54 specific, transcriptional regulator, Fis family [Bryobacterales bacterium]|nr:two component, sigma54 specific, transcriptional regulator, Fis family [Bryobacterales bacterium]